MHYAEYQDRSGFIPKESMKIPLLVQFQIPKKTFAKHASNRIRTHAIPERELSTTNVLRSSYEMVIHIAENEILSWKESRSFLSNFEKNG